MIPQRDKQLPEICPPPCWGGTLARPGHRLLDSPLPKVARGSSRKIRPFPLSCQAGKTFQAPFIRSAAWTQGFPLCTPLGQALEKEQRRREEAESRADEGQSQREEAEKVL